jgi:hypothetical protein
MDDLADKVFPIERLELTFKTGVQALLVDYLANLNSHAALCNQAFRLAHPQGVIE